MRIEQLAEDLVTVLDSVVGDGPVVYAGHSMGGMTLMAAADQHPELFGTRIRAAALVSTSSGQITAGALGLPKRLEPAAAVLAPRALNLVGAGVDRRSARRAASTPGLSTAGVAEQAANAVERGVEQAEERAAGAGRDARRDEGAARSAARGRAVARALSAQVQRSGLRRLVFGKRPDPAEVELFLSDLAVVPGPSYGGFFEAILHHDLGHALKVLDQLPVEVMHGTRDRLLPPRHANRIAAELPSARLWIYPGAGHMLMQERPRDVTHRLASLARKARG
jgi:pimeloyl-ACP methyl ester carboxylesterase